MVLTSPQFLFLVETSGTPGARTARQLRTGFEALLFPVERAAGSQDDATGRRRMLAKQLDAEVDRMIADPRFSRFINEFAIAVAEPG